LKKYTKKLQKIVKELEKKNYYLRKEEKILRELVEDY